MNLTRYYHQKVYHLSQTWWKRQQALTMPLPPQPIATEQRQLCQVSALPIMSHSTRCVTIDNSPNLLEIPGQSIWYGHPPKRPTMIKMSLLVATPTFTNHCLAEWIHICLVKKQLKIQLNTVMLILPDDGGQINSRPLLRQECLTHLLDLQMPEKLDPSLKYCQKNKSAIQPMPPQQLLRVIVCLRRPHLSIATCFLCDYLVALWMIAMMPHSHTCQYSIATILSGIIILPLQFNAWIAAVSTLLQ